LPIPIIDLFAGPGGLGEGFASVRGKGGTPFFRIALSIEKDPIAHRTLTLRAVFRLLRGTPDIRHYYRYIRGEIDETTFKSVPAVAAAFRHAEKEARCLELGKSDERLVDSEIERALSGATTWVLIGGPPCQAYSLAGRARRTRDEKFHEDEKHFLYREYLRIIRAHRPTVFVMENVKGLLSSRHSGNSMFEQIIKDLSSPADNLEYEIRSFVKRGTSETLIPTDFVIHAERYGIPQSRHRVILLGVMKRQGGAQHQLLSKVSRPVTVRHAIDDLPRIRSRLSRGDSIAAWRQAVSKSTSYLNGWKAEYAEEVVEAMKHFADAATSISSGAPFIPRKYKKMPRASELQRWLRDRSVGGICQHEARSHMEKDLSRYLFLASYAHVHGRFPRLDAFPPKLLPDHVNVRQGSDNDRPIPFRDRFRVQCRNEPATTVVSHIAKDGHYYIHYDPSQCRSLTVREAARLQTFPDNYFFSGTRTEQYIQVGNAVPPLLAFKMGQVVRNLLNDMSRGKKSKL